MILVELSINDLFYSKLYTIGKICINTTTKKFSDWMIKKYGSSRSIQYDGSKNIRVQIHSGIELIIKIEETEAFENLEKTTAIFNDLILKEIIVNPIL